MMQGRKDKRTQGRKTKGTKRRRDEETKIRRDDFSNPVALALGLRIIQRYLAPEQELLRWMEFYTGGEREREMG